MSNLSKQELAQEIVTLEDLGDPIFLYTWVDNNTEQIQLDSDNGNKQAFLILNCCSLLRLFPDDSTWDIFIDAIDDYLNVEKEDTP